MIFFRLRISQMVAQKLAENQVIDFPLTPASLSDKDIKEICEVITPGGFASRMMPDRGD